MQGRWNRRRPLRAAIVVASVLAARVTRVVGVILGEKCERMLSTRTSFLEPTAGQHIVSWRCDLELVRIGAWRHFLLEFVLTGAAEMQA